MPFHPRLPHLAGRHLVTPPVTEETHLAQPLVNYEPTREVTRKKAVGRRGLLLPWVTSNVVKEVCVVVMVGEGAVGGRMVCRVVMMSV